MNGRYDRPAVDGSMVEQIPVNLQRSRRDEDRPRIHSGEGVQDNPRYLAGLGLGYRFYLDHHTIYHNETVFTRTIIFD